jgi:hypothetical protein
VVAETGLLKGEEGKIYAAAKAQSVKNFEDIVHADSDNKHGGGGCHWEEGADPSTAKCVLTNPGMDAYGKFISIQSNVTLLMNLQLDLRNLRDLHCTRISPAVPVGRCPKPTPHPQLRPNYWLSVLWPDLSGKQKGLMGA